MRAWRKSLLLLAALAACSGNDSARSVPGSSSATTRPPRATAAAVAVDLTLVSLNVLHGAACTDGHQCDVAHRIELITNQIEAAGCPDVVALEEIATWVHDLLVARRPAFCGGAYKVVFPALTNYVDVEMVLTKVPALDARRFDLAGGLRKALRVQLETDVGVVDLIVTHAGTGADDNGNGGSACAGAASCPPPCAPTGPMFDCQITQLLDIARPTGSSPRAAALLVGDLNLVANARPMRLLFDHGFVDTYIAAGNAECNIATGAGCTSGKVDTDIAALQDPNGRETVRVDYALLEPGTCTPVYDTARDADGDGVGTGLFAAAPAQNGPGGLAFASDHVGVALDLRCR